MSIATARDWLKRSADRVKRSSQLRSSVVTTVPVRSRLLQLLRILAGHLDRGPEQGLLDLGDGGHRDLGRQHVVEDMVVAQIGVGEDIVADRLARPQAAAMADHQPHFGPHHRQMVADRLRVGRADADVDQGDAFAVRRDQVIGGHLVAPPAALRHHRLGVGRVLGDEDAAGARTAPRYGLSSRFSSSTAQRTNSST